MTISAMFTYIFLTALVVALFISFIAFIFFAVKGFESILTEKKNTNYLVYALIAFCSTAIFCGLGASLISFV